MGFCHFYLVIQPRNVFRTDREEMELVVTSPSGRKETIIVVADPEMAAKIRSKGIFLSKIII